MAECVCVCRDRQQQQRVNLIEKKISTCLFHEILLDISEWKIKLFLCSDFGVGCWLQFEIEERRHVIKKNFCRRCLFLGVVCNFNDEDEREICILIENCVCVNASEIFSFIDFPSDCIQLFFPFFSMMIPMQIYRALYP